MVSVEQAILKVQAQAGSPLARLSVSALTDMLLIWAEHDSLAAREFVMNAERFPGRMSALAVRAREKPQDVASWTKANVPKAEWGGFFMPMFLLMEKSSPQLNGWSMSSAFPEKDGHKEMPGEFAEEAREAFGVWTMNDAPAAAEWVLRNVKLVSTAEVGSLAKTLLRDDEAAALTWLAKRPAGALRESAVGEVATVWIERSEFVLADQIVASVSDAERRKRMIFKIYRGTKSGPRSAQAEQWLEAQAINAETKALWRREGGPE